MQVALNQFALGPVVLAASFAWNLVLTKQADKYLSKLRNDGPPSMVNGAGFDLFLMKSLPASSSTYLSLQVNKMYHACRVEVLGAGIRHQFLAGSAQIPGQFVLHCCRYVSKTVAPCIICHQCSTSCEKLTSGNLQLLTS